MKNVTITLDPETARWARMEAARRNTSVSRLVGEMLAEYRQRKSRIEQAWSLEDRLNYSWWDLLILAAAQRSNCTYVLSEDLKNDQTIDNLKILNPFTTTINDHP
ncbi:hypothetical protein [Wenzhouxiangella sp. EGI_FJ10305]|uniref:hypothetical protein n=1 Tax=Wenzhouxiangella sp. EGI_FJ10305 TaxID=3243768 RepID=UPI0035D701CD